MIFCGATYVKFGHAVTKLLILKLFDRNEEFEIFSMVVAVL